MSTPILPPDFTPIQMTGDDLTFDELDRFVELTGTDIGKAPQGKMLRALAVMALARNGVDADMDGIGGLPINQVLDMAYFARMAQADPTVAGA